MEVEGSSTAGDIAMARERRRKEIEELRAFSKQNQGMFRKDKPTNIDGVVLSSPLAQVCASTTAVEEMEASVNVSNMWHGNLP